MSVSAYFSDRDYERHPGTPEINYKAVFYPTIDILNLWEESLRHKGLGEWDKEDGGVSYHCLQQVHEELPYTLAGFRHWLLKYPTRLKYVIDRYIDEWGVDDFDLFRDFIRYGALNKLDATFQ